MRPELVEHFTDPPDPPDWSDRGSVIESIIEEQRAFTGSGPIDEPALREIPDARLIALAGVGHEVPPARVGDTVVPAILEHTARGTS